MWESGLHPTRDHYETSDHKDTHVHMHMYTLCASHVHVHVRLHMLRLLPCKKVLYL